MVRILSAGLVLLLVTPSFADPTFTFLGGPNDFRFASVSGLDVGGTTYNVTFHTNVSWAAYKAANPGTYLPFNTSADASTANDALRDAINAALIDASSGGGGENRTFNIFVAYAETATTFSIDSIFEVGLNPLTYRSGFNGELSHSYNMNFPGFPQAFTTWQVVPEPASATLLGIGAGLVVWRSLRRRRQRHSNR